MKPIPEIISRIRVLLLEFNPNNPGTIFSVSARPPMLSGPYQDFLGNITFFLNTEVGFDLAYLLGYSRIHLDTDPDLEDALSIFRHTLNINQIVGTSGDHPWHIKVGVAAASTEPEAMSMDEVYKAIIEAISVAVDYIAEHLDPETPPWDNSEEGGGL